MSTVLTIGGSTVTLSENNTWPVRLCLRLKGCSTLAIQRRGGPLPGLPDPWLGKTVTLAIGGTTVFAGDVLDVEPSYTGLGWVLNYQCRDLRYRGDRVPFTDANTLTDSSVYNDNPEDLQSYLATRAGRTVGQILTDCLTGTTNATALNARGIGAYTSLSPPTLPADTVSDLALLTIIPPSPVYVQGERLLSAIEAFLSAWAPNHVLWIRPSDGALRVLDTRTFSNHTFTLGTDPVDPTPLRRSVADCFPRVVVRGSPPAAGCILTKNSGGLAEDFAYTEVDGTPRTSAYAKAHFDPTAYQKDQTVKSEGTCTCTDTTHVVVTPTDTSQRWPLNWWDQTATGHLGIAYLYYSSGTGINQFVRRRVVSNTANTAGTSTLTLDEGLPATNYDHFQLYGITDGKSWTYRKYKVVDTAQAAALAYQFTYPQPYVMASGNQAVMTSYPMGSVCWSAGGTPPYLEWPAYFTVNPPNIIFQTPTYITAGNHDPSDVRALLAIYTGSLSAVYPADVGGVPQYLGTSNTVEGLTETLTVTCSAWRDSANQSNMVDYAHDLLDSVKNTIVEGSVVYHGLYSAALTPGLAVSVTGSTYTTGWESLAVPVLEVELHWNSGEATQHTTVMHCSNRRAHFSSAAFLRPDRSREGALVGGSLDWLGGAMGGAAYQALTQRMPQALSAEQANVMAQGAIIQATQGPQGLWNYAMQTGADDTTLAMMSRGAGMAGGQTFRGSDPLARGIEDPTANFQADTTAVAADPTARGIDDPSRRFASLIENAPNRPDPEAP